MICPYCKQTLNIKDYIDDLNFEEDYENNKNCTICGKAILIIPHYSRWFNVLPDEITEAEKGE